MKKILYLSLFICITKFSMIKTKIIEIKNISEVLKYINDENVSKTLILFDIDNTLTEPENDFGGDIWFTAKVKYEINQGLSEIKAVRKVLTSYNTIQKNIKIKPVEVNTVETIHKIQKQNIITLALTSRSEIVLEYAYNQLKSINILFDSKIFDQDKISLKNQKFPAFYYKGLIGCDRNSKGKCLKEFMQMAQKEQPKLKNIKKIIFIDDKEKYLKEVENEFKKDDITFLGLRYSYLDEKVKNYVLKNESFKKYPFLTNIKNKVISIFKNIFDDKKYKTSSA
ncbi:DUF2608 domain-containing protein [Candidatus Dependentiae bacterium]|nr:DUF2608 domain-containing protein [Candidatus Dependentiae bacterium]